MTTAERAILFATIDALRVAPDRRVAFLRIARREDASAEFRDALRRLAEAPPGCVLLVAFALRLELAAAA